MVAQVIDAYSALALPMLGWVVFWFLLSVLIKRNDFVDVAWGLGFVYIAIWITMDNEPSYLHMLVVGLVSLWGLRLAAYLISRNAKKAEDYRYKQWREEWGKSFYIRSFFQVYVLQTLLMLLIAFPVILVANMERGEFNWLSGIGVAVWSIGFYWQTLGDYQKSRFKKNPKNQGQLMTSGLWAKSRHPNYFGELMMWWGIWFTLLPYSHGWMGIVSPLLITYLILKVSGVPMLEAKQRKHPSFEAYQNSVPAVFPDWINPFSYR